MTMREIVGAAKIAKGQYWSKTLTLVRGCTPVSEGCVHCWSAAMASRFPWGKGFAEGDKWTGKVEPNYKAEMWLQHRSVSTHNKRVKPQVICVWNDLFHEHIGYEYIASCLNLMAKCRTDRFLILTKRPERIKQTQVYSYESICSDNIWLGVTVESQKHVHRIDELIEAWPGRKFVSIEPYLEAVDIRSYLDDIDWVIVGCESGPHARPTPCDNSMVLLHETVIDPCAVAGVPVFVKQWNIGKLVKMPELFGKRWDEMPEVE
jgi:protein gp37